VNFYFFYAFFFHVESDIVSHVLKLIEQVCMQVLMRRYTSRQVIIQVCFKIWEVIIHVCFKIKKKTILLMGCHFIYKICYFYSSSVMQWEYTSNSLPFSSSLFHCCIYLLSLIHCCSYCQHKNNENSSKVSTNLYFLNEKNITYAHCFCYVLLHNITNRPLTTYIYLCRWFST